MSFSPGYICYGNVIGWTSGAIDTSGDCGEYCSIAVDTNNAIHVAYYDYTNANLMYASSSDGGNTWLTSVIDSSGDMGKFTSIAVATSSMVVHIAYEDTTNNDLRHAYNGGIAALNTWNAEDVDASNMSSDVNGIGLALDKNGIPWISYTGDATSTYSLRVANKRGGSWTLTTVDGAFLGQRGNYSSITMDSNGRAHISHYDYNNNEIKRAYWGGSSWTNETIYTSIDIRDTSIAKDSDDYTYIALVDTSNDLYYLSNAGGSWSFTTLNTALTWRACSVALDANKKPWILAVENTGLSCFNKTGSAVVRETIDTRVTGAAPVGSNYAGRLNFSDHAIAIKDGIVHVVYQDNNSSFFNLYYATRPVVIT